MLKVIEHLNDLDIRKLMNVYKESNRKHGLKAYRNLPENLQILNAEQDLYAYLELFLGADDTFYALWVAEGVYKAALRVEPYSDGLIITGLETKPDARRNGYGAQLVQEVIRYLKLRFQGKLYSHVERSNIASMKLHHKLGFSKISDSATYIDGSFHRDAVTFCLEI